MTLTSVWILVYRGSGEQTRLQAPPSGRAKPGTVGPCVFSDSKKARYAARHLQLTFPLFTPDAPTPIGIKRMSGDALVQWIRDQQVATSPTMGLILDGALLPLTKKGASWIDRQLGTTNWVSNLVEDEALWPAKLAAFVTQRLTVPSDSPEEFDHQEMAQQVKLNIVPELQSGTFWLYTRGMDYFQLADFEMRQVPAFFVPYVAGLLQNWAVNARSNPLRVGDVLTNDFPVSAVLQVCASEDPYWIGKNQCLTLKVSDIVSKLQIPSEVVH